MCGVFVIPIDLMLDITIYLSIDIYYQPENAAKAIQVIYIFSLVNVI